MNRAEHKRAIRAAGHKVEWHAMRARKAIYSTADPEAWSEALGFAIDAAGAILELVDAIDKARAEHGTPNARTDATQALNRRKAAA